MLKLINFALITSCLLLVGCAKKTVRTDIGNLPITISKEQWRKESITIKENCVLSQPGKIYRKGDYLLISEINKGIHIYNNSNPYSPVEVGFIELYLNSELAVFNDILYVNSYTDLIMLDISNPSMITEVGRLKDIFTITIDQIANGFDYSLPYEMIDPNEVVIIGWETGEIISETNDDKSNLNLQYYNGNSSQPELVFFQTSMINTVDNSGLTTGGGAGVGGSMAKFTISGHNLFMIDNDEIVCFDISTPNSPQLIDRIKTDREAQTLFPRDNQLFVGTTSGMLIYEIISSGSLNLISTFEHFTSCDPVVVAGNYAYVTLSSGCWSRQNQLDVVDISDIANPSLVKSYNFTHPLGLGVDKSTLFLCDDQDGLKVFDVTDPLKITDNKIVEFTNMNAFDVIPYKDLLIMVGTDGVSQYDYSDVKQISKLSTISIQ